MHVALDCIYADQNLDLLVGCLWVQTCAQVLLSLGNLASRIQYLNASNTLTELFSYGTVPIINENDTVAVEELRIGDNDTLSAQVRSVHLLASCVS